MLRLSFIESSLRPTNQSSTSWTFNIISCSLIRNILLKTQIPSGANQWQEQPLMLYLTQMQSIISHKDSLLHIGSNHKIDVIAIQTQHTLLRSPNTICTTESNTYQPHRMSMMYISNSLHGIEHLLRRFANKLYEHGKVFRKNRQAMPINKISFTLGWLTHIIYIQGRFYTWATKFTAKLKALAVQIGIG